MVLKCYNPQKKDYEKGVSLSENEAILEPQKNEDELLLCLKYILDFYYGEVLEQTIRTILAHESEKQPPKIS